jgi:hypothetical protein
MARKSSIMKASKKTDDLDLHWSTEARRVDEEWERAMNEKSTVRHLEDYIAFLESIKPACIPDEPEQRCCKQFTLDD